MGRLVEGCEGNTIADSDHSCSSGRDGVHRDFTPAEYGAILQPAFLIIGVAAGLISVKGGDYWDRRVFNPRYGLKGTWLEREPPALFPPGSDLRLYRKL